MRFGFIGDVHGDLVSLRWALDTLRDVDRVVCLGDMADGPQVDACIELLQQSDAIVVQGNHDYHEAMMHGLRTPRREWLIGLPRLHEDTDFLAWHSVHVPDGAFIRWDYLYHDEDARSALLQVSRPLVFCAHTHVPRVHVLRRGRIERCLSKDELLEEPLVPIAADARHLVNVGRPTQCVVRLEDGRVTYQFHPTPRFEDRFGESTLILGTRSHG